MILVNLKTGEKFIGLIEILNRLDLLELKDNREFSFDWNKEIGKSIYKIRIKGEKEILGLLSIIDIKEEFRIHINLIESSKNNKGKNKIIKNIAGCLIAFACKIAFKKGYGGFVSLVPKTRLINHYHNNYGFVQAGRQMAVYMEASNSLISKYLRNEKI